MTICSSYWLWYILETVFKDSFKNLVKSFSWTPAAFFPKQKEKKEKEKKVDLSQ